jgi:choline kinase
MKIIILAAGKGERLMPLTRNTPKSLLDMGNGNTLLEEQIMSIKDSGVIDEIVLVIGYLAEQIEAKIKIHIHNGIKINTIFNPFYGVSNNLMSMWLAKSEMDSDFMINNGDNLFTPDVFREMVQTNGAGIFLSLNKKNDYDDDDMKVMLQNGLISKVSKKISKNEAQAESPGLALIKTERFRNLFKENLEVLARNKKYINSFWLEAFNLLYERGIPVHPWIFDGSTKWHEVDFHADVTKMKELLKLK